jgi:hypothetical protein
MISVKFDRDSIMKQFRHMVASGKSAHTDRKFKRQFRYMAFILDEIRNVDGDTLEYDHESYRNEFSRLLWAEDITDQLNHDLQMYRVQMVLGLINDAKDGAILKGVPDYDG